MFAKAMSREVEWAIREVVNRFPELLVLVNYNLGTDHDGDNSIFFRVLLKNSAAERTVLFDNARKVQDYISSRIDPAELGYHAYFNFRKESEQESLKEKDWE